MALRRPVARGQIVTWEDVAIDQQDSAVAFRREMEQVFQALN
jgi:predicted homoserine dehydrogenase-like protein